MITFLIFSMPWIIEVIFETYCEKVEKISVNHFWSAVARGILILIIALIFGKWQAILYMVAIHWMFFDYTYNLITRRKWYYLRDGGIDKLLKNIPGYGLLFFRIIILITGFMVYYGYTK